MSDNEPSDEELVRHIRAGNRPAEFELYRRWRPRLIGLVRKYVGNDQAEYVAQLAFSKAILGLSTYKDSRRFAPWIKAVGTHVAIDYVRRESVRRKRIPTVASGGVDQVAGRSPGYPKQMARDEEVNALRACIDSLKEPYRSVVGLHLAGFSLSEIGKMLGEPKSTVQSWLDEAKGRLRSCMTRKGFS